MSNLRTDHQIEIDHIHDRQLAGKDAEIERLKKEVHQLKRDLVDAVHNIQAHSMIVDASEKDAEIEQDQLITELADALSHYALLNDFEKSLIQRAREATR
jgi:hypothetical protein